MSALPSPRLLPKVDIRPATPEDARLILTFIKELAEYEKLSHEVVATEDALRASLFGPKPHAEVLLAYQGDEPAGFCLFFCNYSTFLGKPGLYIEDLFVRPSYRGQSIGKLLLKQVVAIARERDYGRVEWAVLDWNAPAIGFYTSIGAKRMDEWTIFRLSQEKFSSL